MFSKKMFQELVQGSRSISESSERIEKRVDVVKSRRKMTPLRVQRKKDNGESLTMVSAYDFPTARWADGAWVDILFVSDALGAIALGRENALSVSVDEIIYHTRAVRAGAGDCLLLSAMPFQSYSDRALAVANAARIVQEGGAHAVEVEGTRTASDRIAAIVDSGIAVAGHIGLTKTIAARTGHYQVQGTNVEQAWNLIEDAIAFERAGAFMLVLECIPTELAAVITNTVSIPTIGIGAGPSCSGQALVSQDLLGMFDQFCPSFVKKYANVTDIAIDALKAFVNEVEKTHFPEDKHAKNLDKHVVDEVLKRIGESGVASRLRRDG